MQSSPTQNAFIPSTTSPCHDPPPSSLGSRSRQLSFVSARTPPLSFPFHLNTPAMNQLSPSLLADPESSRSSRDSTPCQNLLARIQDQTLPLPSSSTIASTLSQDTLVSSTSVITLPSLDSSSSGFSVASPTVPTPSILSPVPSTAKNVSKPRLDAPIDIHHLTLAPDISPSDPDHEGTGTRSGGLAGSEVLGLTAALINEGPTPTQETFKTLQALSAAPQAVAAPPSVISSFAPPNPATHIIEIEDSPVLASEPSPQVPSRPNSPRSLAGFGDRSHGVGPLPSSSPSPAPSTSRPTSLLSELKTPNVYINGLPPNFPEEQLLAMTKEFGDVVSVRTFTRHVSDRPSGYGFVLFESVDGAERCIEALRKYRNLHPSYSKRIHKIPGTTYATTHAADGISNTPPSSGDPDSFKFRMERLHDTSSTNLYMEGLPLDINEPTLAALVSPYKIMSSRFFQTRLSVPARVIAFVRLETRIAAEEIIERLHGRMVRGWADPGCRISVRFADTGEQRELRRLERMNRDGEQSPARLTVAQAALLSLKGGQLQNTLRASPVLGGMSNHSLPNISPPFGVSNLPLIPATSPNFPTIGLRPLNQSPLLTRGGAPENFLYESPLAHGWSSLANEESFVPQVGNGGSIPSPIQPHLDQPLSSLKQKQTTPRVPHNSLASNFPALKSHEPRHPDLDFGTADPRLAPQLCGYDEATASPHGAIGTYGSGLLENAGGTSRGHHGYTVLEREILQTYIQRQQLRDQVLKQEQSASARPPSRLQLNGRVAKPGIAVLGRRLAETLPTLSEEEFHSQGRALLDATVNTPSLHRPPSSVPPPRMTLDHAQAKLNFTRQRNQTHASCLRTSGRTIGSQGDKQDYLEERTRSTTMPEYMSRNRPGPGSDVLGPTAGNASNMKSTAPPQSNQVPNDNAITNSNPGATTHERAQPSSHVSSRNDPPCSTSHHDHTTCDTHPPSPTSNGNNAMKSNYKHPPTHIETNATSFQSKPGATHAGSFTSLDPHSCHTRRSSGSDAEGSPLDSPALTYSNSTRTPATLSPATPFSAFAEGPPFDSSVVVGAPATSPAPANVADANAKGEVGLGVNLDGTEVNKTC